MDFVGLFVSFTNAIGMGPFIFLVNLYFIALLIPYIKSPLPLAFLTMFAAFIFFSKSIAALFLIWPFELLVILLAFHIFGKNPERSTGFYFVILGMIAFVWVF